METARDEQMSGMFLSGADPHLLPPDIHRVWGALPLSQHTGEVLELLPRGWGRHKKAGAEQGRIPQPCTAREGHCARSSDTPAEAMLHMSPALTMTLIYFLVGFVECSYM